MLIIRNCIAKYKKSVRMFIVEFVKFSVQWLGSRRQFECTVQKVCQAD